MKLVSRSCCIAPGTNRVRSLQRSLEIRGIDVSKSQSLICKELPQTFGLQAAVDCQGGVLDSGTEEDQSIVGQCMRRSSGGDTH